MSGNNRGHIRHSDPTPEIVAVVQVGYSDVRDGRPFREFEQEPTQKNYEMGGLMASAARAMGVELPSWPVGVPPPPELDQIMWRIIREQGTPVPDDWHPVAPLPSFEGNGDGESGLVTKRRTRGRGRRARSRNH